MTQQARDISIWALASHLRDQFKEAAQTGAVRSDSEARQTWYPTGTPLSSLSPPYFRAVPLCLFGYQPRSASGVAVFYWWSLCTLHKALWITPLQSLL